MSQFEQAFAANLATSLYGAFGLAATYTGPDGSIVENLIVLLHRDDARQVERGGNQAIGELQTGKLEVQQSAIAKPLKGGRFAVQALAGVETWTVAMSPTVQNGQHYCTVTRTGTERMAPMRGKE